ncbi:Nitrate/nitrite sensor protein NarX [Streptomyces sp. YIM 130001]|uniref:sensor histidine kinase n=1 Tax=Streptomyces sp. YIM 130001 TaxID=2259644 RepID=UPI000ED0BC85|nr:histidine kinase [Streptomyces sp. YIM 130001]RII18528.1 Nitrate/nitrite sensor protein NarX [Streptomyces sp. YIM 130001]
MTVSLRLCGRWLFGRQARLRWVHLVLGGALLMPYFLVGSVFVGPLLGGEEPMFGSMRAQFISYAAALPLVALSALVFPLARPLSVAAVRTMCGVRDELAEGPARSRAARVRTSAWFTLHLGIGALISGMTLAVPPFAVFLLAVPVFSGLRDSRFGAPGVFEHLWAVLLAPVAGAVFLVLLAACAATAGTLLARWAPQLLAPAPADRLAAAEERAAELAVRNRLARELHDSVGHALSAVTLQASAARRVLDSNPDFVREALSAIEDTTRRTVGELDAVLGLLREGDETGEGPDPAPAPTLEADLDGLLARTRAAGLPVEASVGPGVDLAALPALVSREAYRIVQEGLSNALKHAGSVPVTVRIARTESALEIVAENSLPATPTPTPTPREGGGRGLPGITERARLLGGTATAGAADSRWRLCVHLPLGGPR